MPLESLYHKPDTANRMAEAATAFLSALSPDQKAKTTLDFGDTTERENWHYIPRDRPGLCLNDMDESLRDKIFALIDTGVSETGSTKVRTIISLEPILGAIEGPGRRFPRDSGLYYASIFGTPGGEETWGWRFEGHHISINYTVINGSLVAPAPIFFGANPAQVRHGEQKGLRALKEEEEVARDLLSSLDGEQKQVAILYPNAPDDIITRNVPHVTDEINPEGIAGKDLNNSQRATLQELIEVYVKRLPEELAETQWQNVEASDLSTVHFAWAGPEDQGKGHYYRVLGSSFLAEYDNTQNDANHIHAVWRDFTNDFGEDILKNHYQKSH